MRQLIKKACIDCGIVRSTSRSALRCSRCNGPRSLAKRGKFTGESHPRWRGGRYVSKSGYAHVLLSEDDPFLSMACKTNRRVPEHRIVMARAIGRALTRDEQVHHINGDKLDNRPENLELLSVSEHAALPHKKIKRLRLKVSELEQEVAQLKVGRVAQIDISAGAAD